NGKRRAAVPRVSIAGSTIGLPDRYVYTDASMLTETQELVVFNAVVKHASYAKAAEELSLSPSAVSRIVTRIEERLGVRLVQRTTRKLSLTEAGSAFHARTAQILQDLADAEAEVQQTL